MSNISILMPSDYHLHARQGDMLALALPWSTRVCGRVLLMPNTVRGDGLDGPIATADDVKRYQDLVEPYRNGCDVRHAFKLLPTTTRTITVAHRTQEIPRMVRHRGRVVRPFGSGQTIHWGVEP